MSFFEEYLSEDSSTEITELANFSDSDSEVDINDL